MESSALVHTAQIGDMKIEISADQARKTTHYHIGQRVKILVKKYNDEYNVSHGVIVAFDDFKNLPSITICYIDTLYNSGELKFAHINKNTGDKFEITPSDDKLALQKSNVLERMQGEIDKKQAEIDDVKRKMNYFTGMFGQWFELDSEE